jgi:hypothetical protein
MLYLISDSPMSAEDWAQKYAGKPADPKKTH